MNRPSERDGRASPQGGGRELSAGDADGIPRPLMEVRWRTAWWLLLGSVAVAVCSFGLAWSDYSSAQAFARDAHLVRAVVVERDCAVLCKGGPFVSVAFDHPAKGRIVARLDGERAVRVGDSIDVVYSDDPDSLGFVLLPMAGDQYDTPIRLEVQSGVGALLLAVAAWAVPANLRRLDRRDAERG